MESPAWTSSDLLRLAGERLRDCPAPRDSRARAQPNLRLLRYYMAAGLVDRPTTLRGRVGLYGDRQLRQLVAIKRLQAEGLDLRQIGARLAVLEDSELATLATPKPAAVSHSRGQQRPREEIELAPGITLFLAQSLPLTGPQLRRLRGEARGLLRVVRRMQTRYAVLEAETP